MSIQLLDAMVQGGFEEVLSMHDRKSGLRAFLAIHDTSVGPAFGGIRRFEYLDESQALLDVLRLSRAMTHKCALAGLPAGGAKLVLLDHADLDRAEAYRHIGQRVEEFGGRFYTGPDVGTGPDELKAVAEKTSFVTDPGVAGPGDLAGATADGVFAGLAATLRQLDGEEDWTRRKVVIQGLGGVGERLAKRLVEVGVRVVGADIDIERAERVARRLGIETVDPAREFGVECDVFAPCAMGGILHDVAIQRLKARAVAGAANNVLAGVAHGDQLHRRGILYAPDFAINSGALIRGALFHLNGERESTGEIESRIGSAITHILGQAADENLPPARVALREAERMITMRRASSDSPPLLTP
ncbi:MAG: leucine dehydrogenase [Planctomycetota bacterium]|jgi:leucine dehydrogenase